MAQRTLLNLVLPAPSNNDKNYIKHLKEGQVVVTSFSRKSLKCFSF